MLPPVDDDELLRAAALAHVDDLKRRTGGLVRREDLQNFMFGGARIPLVSSYRGIRKPRQLDAALSILTAYAAKPGDRPYDDRIGADGYPRYKWQGTNAEAADNRALRRAMNMQKPLIWFVGVAPGIFEVVAPVWVVDEDQYNNEFVVALDLEMRSGWNGLASSSILEVREDARRYAMRTVQQRLHQRVFRGRVIEAYAERCAVCRLNHVELLDAAHIRPDNRGGQPTVPNGIALCSIHHAGYDNNILGIRPDYVIEIRRDVLEEEDGPTLRHAIQAMHGQSIILPRQRDAQPDKIALEERYELFRKAS